MDLMALEEEPSPSAGQELGIRVLGRLGETTTVIPSTVEPLHRTYFRDGQVRGGPISWGGSPLPHWVTDQGRWWLPRCANNAGANPDAVARWDWCWVLASRVDLPTWIPIPAGV